MLISAQELLNLRLCKASGFEPSFSPKNEDRCPRMRLLSNWIDIGEGDSCKNVKHIVNKEVSKLELLVRPYLTENLT